MTYVEFYDKTDIENICSCLTHAPNKVIFLTHDKKDIERSIENYRKVFEQRGQQIEFSFKSVPKNGFEKAVEILTNIVEENDECVFDVSGGGEMFILALGVVYERYKDKNIQIQKFNFNTGAVYDLDKDGQTTYRELPQLTVKENIRIYGGDIIYGDIDNDMATYRWDITPKFEADLEKMWAINMSDPQFWNAQIGILSAIEENGTVEGNTTSARVYDVERELDKHGAKYKVKNVIDRLIKAGLIKRFEDDETTVKVTYKDPYVKKCLTKAGQVLEMKVYCVAKNMKNKDGTPYFNDVETGVQIDWDGDIHSDNNTSDTKNEIDVFAMKNMIPVFISCKNAYFKSEEIYKLTTVGERFGDEYAKKIIVMTVSPEANKDMAHVIRRLKDSGIKLIDLSRNSSNSYIEGQLRLYTT